MIGMPVACRSLSASPRGVVMTSLGRLFVKQQSDDSRREGRRCDQGCVKIAGGDYALVNWSSSGFQVKGSLEGLDKGARVPIEFTVTIDDVDYFFDCSAVIVRLDTAQSHLAAVFVEMDDEDRLAVTQYFEENETGAHGPG